ncbi:hypothetical protein [Nocardia australiensis]|uniref:hypothetical protein n=1 Tax=Nocardia australiensis TaxID=2887191 RepID=UPI001D15BE2E|nr:hypothetical protein [Nocardia australiensis]
MATDHPSTIELAGTAWPIYKLEALAAGLVTCLILAVITGSLQSAVLVAAVVCAARWVLARAGLRRKSTADGRAGRVLATH